MKWFLTKNHGTHKWLQQIRQKTQGNCKPTKESVCYNLPLHTHDEDHFHHPQIFKFATGTHTEWNLSRDKKRQ